MHTGEQKKHELAFEYSEITEQIFVGTNLCCDVHFKEDLLEKGITALISLEGERVDAPFGVEFFSWIPVPDNQAPTRDQFAIGVNTLAKLIGLDKKVYVHCTFGHGRAPTLVAAYFISQGDSVEEAVRKIQEKRSVAHLNDTQIAALGKFEKLMR